MKVEIREVPQPKPPKEVVITLSEEEARQLEHVCTWHLDVARLVARNHSGYGADAWDSLKINAVLENIWYGGLCRFRD